MSKKTINVTMHIQELFAAGAVAQSMAEAYAKASADAYSKAWKIVDEAYPQIGGHYYSYNNNGTITRHKRPAPILVQK